MSSHNRNRRRTLDNQVAGEDGTDSERPSKSRRIRLACLRCQRRKIKCDGSVPKCGGCQKASAECVDGKLSRNEGGISRTEAASLYSYIQALETTLRQKQPDTELNTLRPPNFSEASISQAGTLPNHEDISLPGQEVIREGVDRRIGHSIHSIANSVGTEDADAGTHDRSNANTAAVQNEGIAHDIGLVPLFAGVSKYVGPSSGFALTRAIFNRAQRDTGIMLDSSAATAKELDSTRLSRSMLVIQPASLPTSFEQATQLSRTYFEHVHIQYPFLHEPTFFEMLRLAYDDSEGISKSVRFQVIMVLAISASILAKKLPIPFSGESLCALAMRELEKIDVQGSLEGLRCLLLLYMFSLYSPYLAISPWYLNYQFLATVLDLGLQRDLPPSAATTEFDREMSRRIFWVVYTIDRTLATTLGRPIGLRDEACDLRLPEGTNDHDLRNSTIDTASHTGFLSSMSRETMSCAKILFRFARLNSEIKYILHSVNKEVLAYTYPQVPDIKIWQADMEKRLQECHTSVLSFQGDGRCSTVLCSIRYHEMVMHLFRPTPHVRKPTENDLAKCHASAIKAIALCKGLYEADKMVYSWLTIHSVCLSALTMLYCIWTSQAVGESIRVDHFTTVMCDVSVLLSAAGEYWSEARRSRACLDNLARATTRWLIDKYFNNSNLHSQRERPDATGSSRSDVVQDDHPMARQRVMYHNHDPTPDLTSQNQPSCGNPCDQSQQFPALNLSFDGYINDEDLAFLLGAPDQLNTDSDFLMEGLFVDYQPLFQFNSVDTNIG